MKAAFLRTCGLGVLLLSVLLLSACGSGGGGTTAATLNIAFLPKAVNNPYFDSAAAGAQKAAAELKGQFKQVGPSDAVASEQVPYIQTLTTQGVSAIVISADDANAVAPALKQAMAKGIKVVSYDSDTAPDARAIFINQASTEDIGRSEVDVLASQINNTGQIAILSATSTATNQNAWIGFMQDELKKFPNMSLVKIAYGNDDDQTSYNETQALVQAYPDLKGIISPTTVGIAAAARYLKTAGLSGKIALTGLGTPNSLRSYVKDGTIKGFELWDVGHLGYLAYYAAAALVQGKITGKQGETFTAGTLGTFTIGANGVVLLGPPTVFDANNIDQFNF
ncbi:MAG TPA: rhamnose ABC transporter substrate-binding protein [Ktedonobacterales bacterium]|jgi:rhamnose transport system substrate-binding protein